MSRAREGGMDRGEGRAGMGRSVSVGGRWDVEEFSGVSSGELSGVVGCGEG